MRCGSRELNGIGGLIQQKVRECGSELIFAKRLGINNCLVSRWCCGRSKPNRKSIRKIVEFLNRGKI